MCVFGILLCLFVHVAYPLFFRIWLLLTSRGQRCRPKSCPTVSQELKGSKEVEVNMVLERKKKGKDKAGWASNLEPQTSSGISFKRRTTCGIEMALEIQSRNPLSAESYAPRQINMEPNQASFVEEPPLEVMFACRGVGAVFRKRDQLGMGGFHCFRPSISRPDQHYPKQRTVHTVWVPCLTNTMLLTCHDISILLCRPSQSEALVAYWGTWGYYITVFAGLRRTSCFPNVTPNLMGQRKEPPCAEALA